MKKQLMILLVSSAAFLLTTTWVPRAMSESSQKVLVVLFAVDPRLMVIGSDSPSFVLYEDGTAIFRDRTQKDARHFLRAELSQKEKRELLSKLACLSKMKDRYEITRVTDQPINLLSVQTSELKKRVSVYGDLAKKGAGWNTDWSVLPADLVSVFDNLIQFKHDNAKPWTPKYIEVMLWPFDYSKDKPIKWPVEWPGLKDSKTKQRDRDAYSIFLPGKHFEALRALLKRRASTTAIAIDGKKWAISYRFPFPHETEIQEARRGSAKKSE